jgi:hypothetical protein
MWLIAVPFSRIQISKKCCRMMSSHLKTGPTPYPETSGTNYPLILHNIWEDQRLKIGLIPLWYHFAYCLIGLDHLFWLTQHRSGHAMLNRYIRLFVWREKLISGWNYPSVRWAGHVARKVTRRGVHRVAVCKPEEKRPLGRPGCRLEDNITMDLQDARGHWLRIGTFLTSTMNLHVP